MTAWLSMRLGRRVSAPLLQEYGYSFVGGRLLPGEAGPAAQFLYENENHERLTFYLAGLRSNEPDLQFLRDGTLGTFYWAMNGTGYALSGPVTGGMLRVIAVKLCREHGGNSLAWQ